MKSVLLLFSLLSSNYSLASDDMILQTRMDEKSVKWLIEKTRLILSNAELGDGLTDTEELDDSVFTLDELSSDPEFLALANQLSSLYKIDARNATLRIRIPKIFYRVHSISARPTHLQVNDPYLNLRAVAMIQGVDIGLPDGVQVDVMIPKNLASAPESYLTASVKATDVIIPKELPPAEFDLDLQTVRNEEFAFKLNSYNLEKIPKYIATHIDQILTFTSQTHLPTTANDIQINPVTVRLNKLTRSVTFDEFRPFVQKSIKKISGSILKLVGNSLKSTVGPRILRTVFSKTVPSDLAVSLEDFYSSYAIQSFGQADSDQLSLFIKGGLCTNELFKMHGESCVNFEPAHAPIRTINQEERLAAQTEITQKIKSGAADLGLSISEEYLNRLIKTTIAANLWEEMLEEQEIELGPKGAFIVMNQEDKDPEIYLDLIYRGSGRLERIIVNNRHPIRFPLKMSTELKFELRNEVPYLVINIKKLTSTADQILNGIPQFDLQSQLGCVFRREIAGMIMDMASSIEGKNAVDLDIPIFKGLGLEKTFYETSSHGRIHLFFKL